MEKLLVGIEAMKPRVVVCIGRLFSERASESDSTD